MKRTKAASTSAASLERRARVVPAAVREAKRAELYERAARGELGLIEAVRMMRKIANKTQAAYAALVGVSPRVLMDFERGAGNPTLETLEKLLRPFGLEVGVRRVATATGLAVRRFQLRTEAGASAGSTELRRNALSLARTCANKLGTVVEVIDAARAGVIVARVEPRPPKGRAAG
ncbi:MAG: helix-turn-helix transcriptional regulator [Polyangiaceae bacterium]|nr:helix-turn-helix transcriptional regulator [Polyangiaceae bacterium]